MQSSRPILNEVNLHIVAMMVLGAPIFALPFSFWVELLLLVALPQGRIFTRAYVDYPAFKRPSWPYVVANEGLVLGVAALAVAGWYLRRRPG